MKLVSVVSAALGLALLSGTPISAAVSVYLSPEEITARAPLIVEAGVLEKRSGLDPLTGALRTYVTLGVEQVHRGPADLAEVVVREPGGTWGDLVHEIDAVPAYDVGERVFAYLEPAADGALRTVGMFFGKFRLEEELLRGPLLALRDLEGQGTILGRSKRDERVLRADLAALAAAVPLRTAPGRRAGTAWVSHPPEWSRLRWASPPTSGIDSPTTVEQSGIDIALRPMTGDALRFVPLGAGQPTRWSPPDAGLAVTVHVEPAGNPLNDDQAAVDEIQRALEAWTDVPQSRMQLVLGDANYAYTQVHGSPVSNYTGVNIVLFDDPYNDISDPTGCAGVLAVGGYWRVSSGGTVVNNVAFNNALQMYVIFNNGFECFYEHADNLAEVATHEIGHGIGFGHSSVSDAIMRSNAYGNRGPRLGSDDIDAAHCHYPHTLTLTRPNGGETWVAGSVENVEWSVTAESGPDAGTVDLEFSTDGGVLWKPIASGVANDGSHAWTVPEDPGTGIRMRVVRRTNAAAGAPYPDGSCSEDISDGTLSLLGPPPEDCSVGHGLTVEKNGPMIRLNWRSPCAVTAEQYAIYEGNLSKLRGGVWDHSPLTCSVGTELFEDVDPTADSRYYLVAACARPVERSLRPDRPKSFAPCANRERDSCML